MDLLFRRYASPFLLLDSYIASKRLAEFIEELVKIRNDEMTWDVWLHKVYDQTYADFKESLDGMNNNKVVTKEQIGTTVKDSKNILDSFTPEGRCA